MINEKYYADIMLKNPEWHEFAGKVFLIGLLLDWHRKEIFTYLFEFFHGMDISDTPQTIEDICTDMVNYATF